MSRISILGSPAIWKDELLIAAPMIGMNMGWKCILKKDSQNFYSAIVTH
jgi:tRNA(Ile)-lysidine synthase